MISKLKTLFSDQIYDIDFNNGSGGLYYMFARIIKLLRITFATFNRNKLGFQSVAISYYTTLSLIPGLALLLAFSEGWKIRDNIYDILIRIFPFNSDIVQLVLDKAGNLLAVAYSGGIGTISAIAFVWVLLLMMFQVERIFNSVWGIMKIPRKFYKRFGFYVVIILLIPFLILIYGALFVYYSNIPNLFGIDLSDLRVLTILGAYLVLFIVSTFTLSVMYKFIPAPDVKYRWALRAAAVTSIFFILFQYLYLETQVFVGRMNSIYGIIAAVPLFLIWLNISWQIIMYGASMTYALQNFNSFTLTKKENETK